MAWKSKPFCVVDQEARCVVWVGTAHSSACAIDQCYDQQEGQPPGYSWDDVTGHELHHTALDEYEDWGVHTRMSHAEAFFVEYMEGGSDD